MISSILIPTDFSPASWKATKMGLEMTKHNQNAIISILHIYPIKSKYSEDKQQQITPERLHEVRDRMNHLASGLIDDPEKIRNVVLCGDVEKTMLDFIYENEFDLVILGINGNGEDNHAGSHTLSIVENCDVPVMIVPNKKRVSKVVSLSKNRIPS